MIGFRPTPAELRSILKCDFYLKSARESMLGIARGPHVELAL